MSTSESNRWHTAQQLITQHGDGAEMDAAARADAAIAASDPKGESLGLDVLKKIRALQRTDPSIRELN